MLRLITDGPGWTDDTIFFKWEKEGSEPRLIGYNSGLGSAIIFTNQSFDDAVAALTTLEEWYNEDDGTHNYVEGDTPELFNAVDWYEDDNATEDQFFEDAEEFDNVSDYLEQLGYSSEEDDDNLYYYDDAVDYIESQGVSADPGNAVGEYVCDRLDWDADGTKHGDRYYYKETLDRIVEGAKEYAEEMKEDEDVEEWDENILEPAINEINEEKGIELEYEGNGNFGEILTIWSNDPKVKWKESVYNFKDDDDEDEGEFFNDLNIIDPEENYHTKEELKEYILSMLVIKE